MNQNAELSNYISNTNTHPNDTDLQLLQQIANENQEALEELYIRYNVPIYNYILRQVHDSFAAEDILQEVFIGVWKGAKGFEGRALVKTWLFRVAHLQTAYWLRKQTNRPIYSERELEKLVDDGAVAPEAYAFNAWEWSSVRRALDQLTTNHREVIELTFGQGFSNIEAATILDCPVGTVKSRLHYALQQLNRILSR